MIRTLKVQVLLTALGIAVAGVVGGVQAATLVVILAVLEISLSFDNAVVNATVLRRMSRHWQKLFLTVGVLIAVFGMRLVFPMLVVGIAGRLNPISVMDLAINHQAEYASRLGEAHPAIAAFGGVFLLMIFLDFILETREITWLSAVEKSLARIGRLDQLSVMIAGVVLIVAIVALAGESATQVAVAGLLGLLAYLAVNGLSELFEVEAEAEEDGASAEPAHVGIHGAGLAALSAPVGVAVQGATRAGLFLFLYLEVLDASFSFDGVVGAFAVSSNIFIIALGLGIGAMYIRSMTVYLVRQGTLDEYVYLEHGAHYAIGALAVLLLATIKYDVPQLVTGLVGVCFIGMALISSVRLRRSLAPPILVRPAAVA